MLRIVTISDGIGGDYYLPFIYFIPKISTISLYIYIYIYITKTIKTINIKFAKWDFT